MKTKTAAGAVVLALALMAPGFAQGQGSPKIPAPAALDPAIDACAQCKMSVKDSGYAAQAIAEDGRVYWFDDIGCLLNCLSANPSIKAAARYVQDAKKRVWLPLESASYVVSKDAPTPMGYGIHAFASEEAAALFAKSLKGSPKVVALGDLKVGSGSGMGM